MLSFKFKVVLTEVLFVSCFVDIIVVIEILVIVFGKLILFCNGNIV